MAFLAGYALIQVPFVVMDDKEYENYAELFEDDEEEEEEHQPVSAWKETPDAKVLQAEVPGLNKEDLKVEVRNYRVLTITGGLTKQNSKQSMQAYFMRQIPLPEGIKAKEMTATMDDGVLIIKAPKSSSPKPSRRLLAITN